MRKNLIKFLLSAIVCVGAFSLVSCDSDQLSARLAKKAVEDYVAFRDSSMTVKFNVGYYEVSEDDIAQLNKLQKANVITFKTETVVEKKKRWSYSWYSSSSYTENIDHTFAEVKLTEEGRKYLVSEKPLMRKDWEKILRKLENKYKDIQEPDFMNLDAKASEKKEEKKEEAAPEKPVKEEEEEAVDTVAAEEVAEAEAPAEEKPAETAAPANSYEAALERVNVEACDMLVGKLKVVEVLDVFCPEEYVKNGKGECSVVYELVDKTPFGWVLSKEENYGVLHFTLLHTEDNGWIVNKD